MTEEFGSVGPQASPVAPVSPSPSPANEPATPSAAGWSWYYTRGEDLECWWGIGKCASVEEAIEEARSVGGFEPGDTITVLEATHAALPAPDAERALETWIEDLENSDGGYFGEDVGNWDKFPEQEALADLQVGLDAWAERWRSHFPSVFAFGKTRNQTTVTLPELTEDGSQTPPASDGEGAPS